MSGKVEVKIRVLNFLIMIFYLGGGRNFRGGPRIFLQNRRADGTSGV